MRHLKHSRPSFESCRHDLRQATSNVEPVSVTPDGATWFPTIFEELVRAYAAGGIGSGAGGLMSQVPNIRCIAISRQQGSGGSYIGRGVAERLGFRYFDREMLRTVAEYLKEHEHDSNDEPLAASWFDRLGTMFALGTFETGLFRPLPPCVTKASSWESKID